MVNVTNVVGSVLWCQLLTHAPALMSDEEDPWDQRITQTGCAHENEALQICRFDTGDWRKCLKEMQAFRDCWSRHNNKVGAKLDETAGEDYNLTGETHDR